MMRPRNGKPALKVGSQFSLRMSREETQTVDRAFIARWLEELAEPVITGFYVITEAMCVASPCADGCTGLRVPVCQWVGEM